MGVAQAATGHERWRWPRRSASTAASMQEPHAPSGRRVVWLLSSLPALPSEAAHRANLLACATQHGTSCGVHSLGGRSAGGSGRGEANAEDGSTRRGRALATVSAAASAAWQGRAPRSSARKRSKRSRVHHFGARVIIETMCVWNLQKGLRTTSAKARARFHYEGACSICVPGCARESSTRHFYGFGIGSARIS